jgi:ribosomal protein L13
MVLTKTKVIDGRDHMLGRLASVVGKELLAGQTIVIVRCDEMVVSGSCECNAVELMLCWRLYPSEEDNMQLIFSESMEGFPLGIYLIIGFRVQQKLTP